MRCAPPANAALAAPPGASAPTESRRPWSARRAIPINGQVAEPEPALAAASTTRGNPPSAGHSRPESGAEVRGGRFPGKPAMGGGHPEVVHGFSPLESGGAGVGHCQVAAPGAGGNNTAAGGAQRARRGRRPPLKASTRPRLSIRRTAHLEAWPPGCLPRPARFSGGGAPGDPEPAGEQGGTCFSGAAPPWLREARRAQAMGNGPAGQLAEQGRTGACPSHPQLSAARLNHDFLR